MKWNVLFTWGLPGATRQLEALRWAAGAISLPLKPPCARPPDIVKTYFQLPPEPGLVAEAGVVALGFLCIFLCEVPLAGAMVFDPDAPDTVSVEPPAFGLLIPVPP